MKKIFTLIVFIGFVFCIAGLCFAAYEFYSGTITKISGQYYTIRDDNGNVTTVKGSGTPNLKIGDRVNVQNGMIIGDSGRTNVSPHLNPQPEPPLPTNIQPHVK
jgi:hypothetical protein